MLPAENPPPIVAKQLDMVFTKSESSRYNVPRIVNADIKICTVAII